MTDKELLQMALEWVEWFASDDHSVRPTSKARETAEAIKVRLAQPEPEPVAVVGVDLSKVHMYIGHNYVGLKPENKTAIFFKDVPEGTPLYTAPTKKEWVGLTDEEITKIVDTNTTDDNGYDIWCNGKYVARDVEAKLKEKNT